MAELHARASRARVGGAPITVRVFNSITVTVFTSTLVEVPGNRAYEKEKN